MNNISILNDCYGCGICAASCPQDIIRIKKNRDGFYTPVITSINKCTDCGLCLKTCSFSNNLSFDNEVKGAYAAWSTDTAIRQKASTGGVAFELAKHALSVGHNVCGVIYDNTNHRAVHRIIADEEELHKTIGSKYIPSATLPAFIDLVSKTNIEQKYIVFATPCQIASLRLLINKLRREDNFILIDFFCHGVPSLNVWDKYVKDKNIGHCDNIKWRDKKHGWHNSWYIVGLDKSGKEEFRSEKVSDDEFFRSFLGHYALNPCCLNSCKFKRYNSLADIRIGDLWGQVYSNNEQGVNGVLCMTEKGNEFFKSVSSIIHKSETPDIVAEGQMTSCATTPPGYCFTRTLLRHSNLSLKHVLNLVHLSLKAKSLPKKIIQKLLSTCHI